MACSGNTWAGAANKKPDTDNIFKLVTDALSGVIYADDKQIVSCRVQKWYSEEPRTEVRIAMVTDEVIDNEAD